MVGNNAVNVNTPDFNGVLADIHITNRGSSWYWACFSIFSVFSFVFLGLSFKRAPNDRIFHWITTAIVITAATAYFTMASDLGFVPVRVEFAGHEHSMGTFRQVFYVRYIDWAITTPLLLTDLLLTAGLSWPHILFVIFMDLVMVVTGLVGALVVSNYKWGFFTLGCVAFIYIAYVLLGPARLHAKHLGPEVSKTYNLCGVWLVGLWCMYPIAWGVCEGANIISPDSEAVFYGILDILAKGGFGSLLLWGHRNIDPALLGLRSRGYDEVSKGNHSTEKSVVGHQTNGGGVLNGNHQNNGALHGNHQNTAQSAEVNSVGYQSVTHPELHPTGTAAV